MATKTEEIRLKFSSDTKEIKTAGRDFRAFTNDMLQGERRVKSNLTQLAGSFASANSGADLVAGGIDHLASTLKMGTGALVGIAVATKVVTTLSAKAAETQKVFTDASELSQKSLRPGRYMTAADGVSALTDEYEKLTDVINKTEAVDTQYGDTSTTWSTLKSGVNRAANDLFNPESKADQQIDTAKVDQDIAGKSRTRIRAEITKAANDQADIQGRILKGDERGAKLAELEIKRAAELNAVKIRGIGDESAQQSAINRKFDAQVSGVKKEKELFDGQLDSMRKMSSISNSFTREQEKRLRVDAEDVAELQKKLQTMKGFGETPENSEKARGVQAGLVGAQQKQYFDVVKTAEQDAMLGEQIKLKEKLADIDASTMRDQDKVIARDKATSDSLIEQAEIQKKYGDEESDQRKNSLTQAYEASLAEVAHNREIKKGDELLKSQLQSQQNISKISSGVQSNNVKQVEIEREKLRLINEQIESLSKNGEWDSDRVKQLKGQAATEADASLPAELRFFGMKEGARNRMFRGQRRAERKRNRLMERYARNGGLVDTVRDINGDVIEGRDPVTGMRTTPSAGGQAERGVNMRPDDFVNHFSRTPYDPQNAPEKSVFDLTGSALECLKIIANKEGIQ